MVSEGEEEFGPGAAMWVPKGVHHQHRNTGTEPLKLLWVYTPPGGAAEHIADKPTARETP